MTDYQGIPLRCRQRSLELSYLKTHVNEPGRRRVDLSRYLASTFKDFNVILAVIMKHGCPPAPVNQ